MKAALPQVTSNHSECSSILSLKTELINLKTARANERASSYLVNSKGQELPRLGLHLAHRHWLEDFRHLRGPPQASKLVLQRNPSWLRLGQSAEIGGTRLILKIQFLERSHKSCWAFEGEQARPAQSSRLQVTISRNIVDRSGFGLGKQEQEGYDAMRLSMTWTCMEQTR
jgi:hypothetical protein